MRERECLTFGYSYFFFLSFNFADVDAKIFEMVLLYRNAVWILNWNEMWLKLKTWKLYVLFLDVKF